MSEWIKSKLTKHYIAILLYALRLLFAPKMKYFCVKLLKRVYKISYFLIFYI